VPAKETYTLHHSLDDLKAAINSRCHFCTLVWATLTTNHDGSTPLIKSSSPVTIQITRGDDGGSNPFDDPFELFTIHIICDGIPWVKRGTWEEEYGRSLTVLPHAYQEYTLPPEQQGKPSPAHTRMSTSSKDHEELAQYWLGECLRKHQHCRLARNDFRPNRLLDVGLSGHSQTKLRIIVPDDRGIEYCTLSHCWGGANDILRLTKDTMTSLIEGISIFTLPKTFQDAIRIAQSLGYRYLWIDSLCIVQDSREDWAQEANEMGSIFENSVCTIAAAAARNAHEGCFVARNPLAYTRCRIAGSSKRGLYAGLNRHYPTGLFRDLEVYSPLHSRAWVVQELALSSRTLHYGRQGLFWSCRNGDASEFEADGIDGSKIFDGIENPLLRQASVDVMIDSALTLRGFGFRPNLRNILEVPIKIVDELSAVLFHVRWFAIVMHYTACSMTKPEDRLIALSGIAQRIQSQLGLAYVAGLWKESLSYDLLWRVDGELNSRPLEYRAPSWSWASVDGKVYSPYVFPSQPELHKLLREEPKPVRPLIRIVSVNVSTLSQDTSCTGQVSDGLLKVVGVLRKIKPPNGLLCTPASQSPIVLEDDISIDLFPDTDSEMLAELSLLPVRRLTADYRLYAHRWERKLKTPISIGVEGIALRPISSSYERVGLFHYHQPKSETHEIQWFDSYTKQTIELR
jgi:Heterokaryon incompatibility protein (HET)